MFRAVTAFDDESLRRKGYDKIVVSLFDHWLSDVEYAACRRLSFDMAVQAGLRDHYEREEQRFLTFYGAAFAAGVYCAGDGPLTWRPSWNADLIGVVRDSLRERRLMDVYVPALRIRVMGGYDRTDLLLLDRYARRDDILQLIRSSGLFAL